MDHVAGPLHILLAEKVGRIWFNLICLKFYQFKKITWWCLCVLESILEYVLESTLKHVLKSVMLNFFFFTKNHGLSEFLLGSPPRGGPDANSNRPCTLMHSLPWRTPCRLFIHGLFFQPLDLHLLVWSELERSPPFRPMRALTWPWSGTFNLVCEVALMRELPINNNKGQHLEPIWPHLNHFHASSSFSSTYVAMQILISILHYAMLHSALQTPLKENYFKLKYKIPCACSSSVAQKIHQICPRFPMASCPHHFPPS